MNEYEDLGTYNGEPEHDMMVDYDYYINTGELSDLFEGSDLEEYVNDSNDCD